MQNVAGHDWANGDWLQFGEFKLSPGLRLLLGPVGEVRLGARAFDLLVALTRHPNEVVSKRDLLAEAWPGLTVEEGALRVHLSGLRKALQGESGRERIIVSVAGRGYSFVEPVKRLGDAKTAETPPAQGMERLPSARELIGRDQAITEIKSLLTDHRLVTVVGPGGVGKTAVAIAIAHELASSRGPPVKYVDLTRISESTLIGDAIAQAIGFSVRHVETGEFLLALKPLKLLLVVDNCEHMIAGVATLLEEVLEHTPLISVLATSREPLRLSGERVHRLPPLDFPATDVTIEQDDVDQFSSLRLFVDRFRGGGFDIPIDASSVSLISQICRRLDGIPLAIELAAGRAGVFGLAELLRQLALRVDMHWEGHRNARFHQSGLRATLAWSYELLDPLEQQTLRRLATFVGPFSISDVKSFLGSTGLGLSDMELLDVILRLATKSLLMVEFDGGDARYRVLETTRAFCFDEAAKNRETRENSFELAKFCCRMLLEGGKVASEATSRSSSFFYQLGNIFSSLEWCYGDDGDLELGLDLTALAAPYFLARSLSKETVDWCDRGIARLPHDQRGSALELRLATSIVKAHALSGALRGGRDEQVQSHLRQNIELARLHGDIRSLTLTRYYLELMRDTSETQRERDLKDSIANATIDSADPLPVALARARDVLTAFTEGKFHEVWIRGSDTLTLFEALPIGELDAQLVSDYRGMMAINQWYRGFPDQAAVASLANMSEALASNDLARLIASVVWGANVFNYLRRWPEITRFIDKIDELSSNLDNSPAMALMRWVRANVDVANGHRDEGVLILTSLRGLPDNPQVSMRVGASLAEIYLGLNQPLKALDALSDAKSAIDVLGRSNLLPDIIRLRGEALLQLGPRAPENAIGTLEAGLDLTRQADCVGMELRLAISLGRAFIVMDRGSEIESLVRPIYERFTEGFESEDLVAARQLLSLVSRSV